MLKIGLEPVMMSTFGVVRFREPFLFLFAGREVRLPSRRRALLAWGSGDCLDFFFLRLLLLPIASLFAPGHVSILRLTTGCHLRATLGWILLASKGLCPKLAIESFRGDADLVAIGA